jgi:hypothetical protein
MDFEVERDQREFRERSGRDEIIGAHVEGPPRLLPPVFTMEDSPEIY